jgi:signal transduction histidine kinase
MKLPPIIRRIGSGLRATVAGIQLRARNEIWPKIQRHTPSFPKRVWRFLLGLLIISIVAAAGSRILKTQHLDETHSAWSTAEISRITKDRLKAIGMALDSTRDGLSTDPAVLRAAEARSVPLLFPLLRDRDSIYSLRLPDSAQYITSVSGDRHIADHGSAFYSPEGRLLAWYASRSATFGFDTTLMGEMLLPSRDRGLILENEPIYAYLTAIRKLVTKDGRVFGYIEAKRQLSVKEPLSTAQASSFIDDIKDQCHRDIDIEFSGSDSGLRTPGHGWTRVGLYADPTDPASFVGTLTMSDRPSPDSSVFYKVLHAVWSLGFTLAIFTFLLWLLTALAETPQTKHPLIARFLYSLIVLVALITARILFAELGGLGLLIGPQFQDPGDFASDWGWGIVQNPFELFITTVFATAVAVMLWIIWMPRERLVRDDSRKKNIEQIVRQESGPLILFILAAVIGAQLLTDILSATVESIVNNGGMRYLVVGQVLPSAPMLMMLLSLLGIGITYLFLASLILTFALRAAIFLLSRKLSLGLRIFGGSLILAVLTALVVQLLDQAVTNTDLNYRAVLAVLTFGISLSIILIDAFVRNPLEHGPSFLYKLPRSSRSILFILAGSALIMSPLVAQKQLQTDRDIAERIVEENARIDTPELETVAAHILSTAGQRLDEWNVTGHDTTALRQQAFLIWLTSLREHPQWNAVVDLYNAQGHLESHFATLGAVAELHRLRGTMDSTLQRAHTMDTATNLSLEVVPCFTSSCTPAIVGSLRYPAVSGARDSSHGKPISRVSNSGPRLSAPLFVSIALWSDLPALTVTRSSFDLLAGGPPSDPVLSDPLTDGGFIVAQYRLNARRVTNAPSLDVPVTVPAYIEQRLQTIPSLWNTTIIGGSRYQTLYFRTGPGSGVRGSRSGVSDSVHRVSSSGARASNPGSRTRDAVPAIITVSVPEPTFGRTMEFALRLNAIGLIYGTLVVLVLLIIRQVAGRSLVQSRGGPRPRFTLRFRDRIFLIVLLIALLPLVVVTNVTRTLLSERAQVEQQDRLARDASVIKDRVSRLIETPTSVTPLPQTEGKISPPSTGENGKSTRDLQNGVDDLAQIVGRDFSVYDAKGLLRASSRPELYESSLLASNLSSNAVQEVILGKRSFFTEPVHIGTQTYEAGYQPVFSAEGAKLIAIISLVTMDEQFRIEAQIARTTSFIYGTFAALGLVLLGIGALFAARVASPIMTLISATERVAQGKLKTSIPVDRDDEIGDLMQAFNAMTGELEKSREIVAQTERELAWKEMARQVAHEIKNPLTPMKLSVQHLEHAHETKDPNFNSIFRRVIRTMSEQIDVLTRIATEFSRFGAMPRRKWGPVSLRRVSESAVALFDSERSRIRFIVDVPRNLPAVHSDEEELRRTFVNLLRNAVQAIDGWGIIIIRAWMGTGPRDQGMIHVRLSDTGSGMNEQTLKKAFDPNFSTKTSGMGLGLAIVKKTITDMSGTIRVESTLGHGTSFFIDLPARGPVEEEE